MRVGLFPFGHIFRAGSRIKVPVEVSGGHRARWAYDVVPEAANNEIVHGPMTPSRVLLPLVTGVDVPTDLLPWGSLREHPCRPAAGAEN